jgi:hypothetical protein
VRTQSVTIPRTAKRIVGGFGMRLGNVRRET